MIGIADYCRRLGVTSGGEEQGVWDDTLAQLGKATLIPCPVRLLLTIMTERCHSFAMN